jgi:cystathionine gamma-synthase/methionine-gamma-lyase
MTDEVRNQAADREWDLSTRAVHTGERPPRPEFTPVTTPIYPSAAYLYDDLEMMDSALAGVEGRYVYTRYGNPTVTALEAVVADLEGMAGAIAFSSGMAALQAAIVTTLSPGDAVVASKDLYGQTISLLSDYVQPWGCPVHFVDLSDLESVAEVVEREKPKLVIGETISNPLVKVLDVPALVQLAKSVRATVLIDSTFAPPVLYQSAKDGAHLVVHSLTKYFNGHGDTTGGIVATSRMRRDQLSGYAKHAGGILGPFEAWLILRGTKTLSVRFERQCRNALRIARGLAEHPGVGQVYYPGLASHPSHEIAVRLFQDRGFGAMIGFTIKDAGREEIFRYLKSLKLIVPATSLGDVYSLSLYPAMSSHRTMPEEQRVAAGIGDDFVRLSVGIEDADDLLADLDQAIRAACSIR